MIMKSDEGLALSGGLDVDLSGMQGSRLIKAGLSLVGLKELNIKVVPQKMNQIR
jgi:hypothetical protein